MAPAPAPDGQTQAAELMHAFSRSMPTASHFWELFLLGVASPPCLSDPTPSWTSRPTNHPETAKADLTLCSSPGRQEPAGLAGLHAPGDMLQSLESLKRAEIPISPAPPGPCWRCACPSSRSRVTTLVALVLVAALLDGHWCSMSDHGTRCGPAAARWKGQ